MIGGGVALLGGCGGLGFGLLSTDKGSSAGLSLGGALILQAFTLDFVGSSSGGVDRAGHAEV